MVMRDGATTRQAANKPRFRVGDHVAVAFGPRPLPGTILEIRGDIGRGGERLYLVSIPMAQTEPMRGEFYDSEMEPLREPSPTQP